MAHLLKESLAPRCLYVTGCYFGQEERKSSKIIEMLSYSHPDASLVGGRPLWAQLWYLGCALCDLYGDFLPKSSQGIGPGHVDGALLHLLFLPDVRGRQLLSSRKAMSRGAPVGSVPHGDLHPESYDQRACGGVRLTCFT